MRLSKGSDPVKLTENSTRWMKNGISRMEYATISGEVHTHSLQRAVIVSCSLRYLTVGGLVHDTSCTCQRFREDGYGCEHVAALLTALLAHEEGDDVLRGTVIEQRLRDTVMVEDPFMPGVLQRTDDRLLSLLEHTDVAELPTWHKTIRQKEQMGLDLVF